MAERTGPRNNNAYPDTSSESEDGVRSTSRANENNNTKNSGVSKGKLKKHHEETPATPLTKLNKDDLIDVLNASEASEEEPPGLTDNQFLKKCRDYGFNSEEADQLLNDIKGFIESNIDLHADHIENIEKKKDQLKTAKNLPGRANYSSTVATTAKAGAAAYLTSFLCGKIAANFTVLATGSPHGAWAFLIAGLLNPLISEPLANAIRNNGAAYESTDGIAFVNYRTATFRLEKATADGNQKRIDKWTKVCADIVDSVIEREQNGDIACFFSGVKDIRRDKFGYPINKKDERINKKAIEDSVMAGTWKRAFLTDELPFFIFSGCYILSGAVLPYVKVAYSPLAATLIDLSISGSLGTFAGAATGMTQNFLRKKIQGGKLVVGMSSQIKGAHLALASAQREAWGDRRTMHEKTIRAIEAKLEALNVEKEGSIGKAVIEFEELTAYKNQAEQEYKKADKNWRKYQREHERYSSKLKRITNNFSGYVAAYSGEKSLESKPMEGRRALNRTIAKAISVPISLCASCLYNSLVVGPSLASLTNSSVTWTDPDYNNYANTTLPAGPVVASAMAGFPLIIEFVARTIVFQGVFEKIITWMEPAGEVEDSDDDDSYVVSSVSDSDDEFSSDSSSAADNQDHISINIPKKETQSNQNQNPAGSDSENDEGYSTAGDDNEDDFSKSESDKDNVEPENKSSEYV